MIAHFASHPVAQVALLDGTTGGLRQIESFGSILGVRAGPYTELERLMDFAHSGYLAYIIAGLKVYTGLGDKNRKIGEKIDGLRDSQVYLIYSRDERHNKFTASYLEARLIEIAADLGITLANQRRPFGPISIVNDNFEQLVQHAQILLAIAGFTHFEKARQSTPPKTPRIAVTGDIDDVRIVAPDQIEIPPEAVRMELDHPKLRAEGYKIGDRLLVLPGSDYSYAGKSGISPANRERRDALEQLDIFETIPGFKGRARLTVGLDCKSPPIAATIVTGEHLKNDAWRIVAAAGASS
jgi:hypothetical protein